jgi:hypothetical protein
MIAAAAHPKGIAPGFLLWLLQLSNETYCEPCALADYIREHKDALREGFVMSSEPENFREIENCAGIYVRQQFKATQVKVV